MATRLLIGNKPVRVWYFLACLVYHIMISDLVSDVVRFFFFPYSLKLLVREFEKKRIIYLFEFERSN